jgi:hypothetical protein
MEKLAQAENIAAQRLRKTFKYPSESDDEDAVEAGMDEQGTYSLFSSLYIPSSTASTLLSQALNLQLTLAQRPHSPPPEP